ncbi:hypothetical protein C5167_016319 [Papaver somniferum]|nr:hypothetical protein C5167_016319 [Papaver somniferum]
MMRTRLVSFGFGFCVAGAAIAQFVWKDLLTERISLTTEVKHKFDGLEARISTLESLKLQKKESARCSNSILGISGIQNKNVRTQAMLYSLYLPGIHSNGMPVPRMKDKLDWKLRFSVLHLGLNSASISWDKSLCLFGVYFTSIKIGAETL